MVKPNINEQTCYSFLLKPALNVAKQNGVSCATLLQGTDIPSKALTDHYLQISHFQEKRLYMNLIDATGNPGIGLNVGYATSFSDIGALGLSFITADSIAELRNNLRKFYNLVQPHLRWEREIIGNVGVHRFYEYESLGRLKIFFVERCLGVMQRMNEELSNNQTFPLSIDLDYPDPGYKSRYLDLFQCPITFNQAQTEIRFPVKGQNTLLPTRDPLVQKAMTGVCEHLALELNSNSDVVKLVKLTIQNNTGRFPNIEKTAERLGISSRTLRRKLSDKNTRFQLLLDEVRQDIAKENLKNSQLTVQQIAELCGFSEAKNFSKTFKRWTGKSPTQFRDR